MMPEDEQKKEEKVDNDRDKCGKTRYVRIQIWFRNLFQYRDYALYTSISMNVFRKHLGVLDLGVLDLGLIDFVRILRIIGLL